MRHRLTNEREFIDSIKAQAEALRNELKSFDAKLGWAERVMKASHAMSTPPAIAHLPQSKIELVDSLERLLMAEDTSAAESFVAQWNVACQSNLTLLDFQSLLPSIIPTQRVGINHRSHES